MCKLVTGLLTKKCQLNSGRDNSLIGRIRGFLGVYSGRIGKGEIHAQLGIVWKSKVIEEIIIGQIRGNIEFQTGKKNNGL